MTNKLIKTLILSIALIFGTSVFASTEGDVIVVTNVPYTATLIKKPSIESATINPETGTHSGLSSVFTLQTNGGDDYFDYVINSYIDIQSSRMSAFGNDGRILFAHATTLPDPESYANANSSSGNSKNIFAYPTNLVLTGSRAYSFKQNYKTYGNSYVIYTGTEENGDVTFNVPGTPISGTYEAGLDEAGTYKSTIVFTIASK